MKKYFIILAIALLFMSGCRTLDGGSYAGAGTYPVDSNVTGAETVLATQDDATKSGGFAVVRIPLDGIPISTATLAALDAKQGLDADLTDLADGELTGSKVGAGINASNITTGTIADERIAATLTRDTELTAGLAGKFNTPTGTASQVVLGNGTLGALPSGSTIVAGTDPTKAAAAESADSLTPTKTSGVPGMTFLYEANGTDTDGVGLIGPLSVTGKTLLRLPHTGAIGQILKISEVATGQTLPDGSTGTILTYTNQDDGGGGGTLSITQQATDPAFSGMTAGDLIVSLASGDMFYKSATGGYVFPGVYTVDPTTYTITVTQPTNGTITCSDADLSTPIICGTDGSACSATAASGAAIAGVTATADSGYALSAFTGDAAGQASPFTIAALTGNYSFGATFAATGGACTDCSGTTAIAAHFENNNDVNAGTPCGCANGDTSFAQVGMTDPGEGYTTGNYVTDGSYCATFIGGNSYLELANTNDDNFDGAAAGSIVFDFGVKTFSSQASFFDFRHYTTSLIDGLKVYIAGTASNYDLYVWWEGQDSGSQGGYLSNFNAQDDDTAGSVQRYTMIITWDPSRSADDIYAEVKAFGGATIDTFNPATDITTMSPNVITSLYVGNANTAMATLSVDNFRYKKAYDETDWR